MTAIFYGTDSKQIVTLSRTYTGTVVAPTDNLLQYNYYYITVLTDILTFPARMVERVRSYLI